MHTCVYTHTQTYFCKILLFNQFTTGQSVFWRLSVPHLFLHLPFQISLFGPGHLKQLSCSKQLRTDLKHGFVFFAGKDKVNGRCLCLWYGSGNSQAVKSITNKIGKFHGMEFVRTEQLKMSAFLFVEHAYERCGILKISWYSVMSRTIHPTPYFCTQEGKS